MNNAVSKSLRTFHLVSLYLLMAISLIAVIVLLSGVIEVPLIKADIYKTAVIYAWNCVLLVFGIIYSLRWYRKNAALHYKAFLTTIAISNVISLVFSPFMKSNTAFLLLLIIQSILLLVLAFGKDLGKRNTWLIYSAVMLIQAVITVLVITASSSVGTFVYIFISVFAKLLLFGTIGLSIKGKFADKAARGTK